ncbi:hypothetical protein EV278_11731 [Caulobacter sp. BK020]|nr:hypothetical protein EV278_11731 [Caulobacter sp. BK020]
MRHLIKSGLLALALLSAPVVGHAQATRTWVSGVGDDVNPCSRTAPCKTFAGAISKTAAGGEINVLDPGGFGTVTITKSITIGTDPALGGTLNASTNGILINAAATDTVTLRGLVIMGPTTGVSTGLNGVRILQAGAVNIENCYIYGNRAAAPNGNGIVALNSSGTLRLNVVNTLLSENGAASTGAGILVQPTGSGSAIVSFNHVTAIDNARGVQLDASSTSGSVKGTIANSNLSNNTLAGIHIVSAGATASIYITDTNSSNNAGGVNSIGAGAVALVNRSSFVGNAFGFQPLSGGLIQSYVNNAVTGNGADGAPTSTITPK